MGKTMSWERVQPWVVCLTSALFFFFVFIQLNMFNAMGASLMRSFDLTAGQLGALADCYFYTNVLFLLPAGLILDRFSTRWLLLIAMGATVMATYCISLATEVWMIGLCRAVVGAAATFCLLSSVRLASRWFEPKRMALVIGWIVTLAMFGGMVAQKPMALAIAEWGWREAIVVDALLGLVIWFLIFIIVRDQPAKALVSSVGSVNQSGKRFWANLAQALGNPQNWLAGLYASLINLPIFLLGAAWGVMYLQQVHGVSTEHAPIVTSMLFVGMIIGSPLIGGLSDRLQRRRMPMIVGAILSLLVIAIIMVLPPMSWLVLAGLFLLLGLVISSQILAYPLIAESNPLHMTATANGVASTIIQAGGFSIMLFPMLMNIGWSHTIVNQIPVYASINYTHALLIMPVGFFIAWLLTLGIKETYCKRERQSA